MFLFKCNWLYEVYFPPHELCLKYNNKTINAVTSGGYVLSTKYVDNSVDTVDKFHNCHIFTGALTVCIVNKHVM